MDDPTWECIIVGGGAAGLSAALVLGRARRRTLVVDAGLPSNGVGEGIGGLLGSDQRSPEDFYGSGRDELTAYPSVELRAGEVVDAERTAGGFVLTLADGSRENARRVLLASGMEYRRPSLAGVEERWGHSVFHCPFCDGWEHRDRPLGVLDRGASAAHRALLLRSWSDDVTVFADGPAELEPDEADELERAGVSIEERPVAALEGPAPSLTAVAFADGSERTCHGLLVPVTLHQRSALARRLGAATRDPTPLVADGLAVDQMCETTVPGLFAAGDASAVLQSVANAVASGHTAGAMIVRGLTVAPSAPHGAAEANVATGVQYATP